MITIYKIAYVYSRSHGKTTDEIIYFMDYQ